MLLLKPTEEQGAEHLTGSDEKDAQSKQQCYIGTKNTGSTRGRNKQTERKLIGN